MIELDLSGRVALVTGAASGIGRAAANEFARAGAGVVVADTDRIGGEETAKRIRADGRTAVYHWVDVTSEESVAALLASTLDHFGQLDFALNNAGISQHGTDLVDLEESRWSRTIAVNLTGVFFCMKHEIRAMIGRGGAIVNTSSASAFNGGSPGAASYTASKHGVIGLTKSAALDYAACGIRVNAICPGAIDTPLIAKSIGDDPDRLAAVRKIHPLGRFGDPEEVGRAAVWLCSDQASFITGIAMPVDGGAVAHN